MNPPTRRELIAGPAGDIECAIDEPMHPRGVAVLAHPHPQMGGTLDNKVVHTLARASVAVGLLAVRFNFRGVGRSAGTWDAGRGEVDDLLAVIRHFRPVGRPFVLGGFSFGGYAAARAARELQDASQPPDRLVLIGPATGRFEVTDVDAARTLVVHGERDDVVALTSVLDWARPQSLPVVVVPGVGHFFHGQLNLLKDWVVRDLRATLPPSPPAP